MTKEMYGEELMQAIVKAYKSGGKVLICGNGGLAAEAEHFAAEMMGKFAFDVFIPCLALTTNTSLITALANDIGFKEVFAHQVRTLGKKGDVLIAMTTTRSKNVVKAAGVGMELGLVVAVICGMRSLACDAHYFYMMHSKETAAVQNEIVTFLHYLAYNCKRRLKSKKACKTSIGKRQ
jgi:phosphoheptose isomerase